MCAPSRTSLSAASLRHGFLWLVRGLILASSLSLVVFYGATARGAPPASPSAPEAAQNGKYPGGKVDFQVTAKDLVREFVANPEKAKAKYEGKTLRVEGVISSLRMEKIDDSTLAFVYLAGNDTAKVETVISAESGGRLKEGQTIAIFGSAAAYAPGEGLVSLYQCELAKSEHGER